MKRFFKEYSFYSLKMFLNQFGMAMLGLTLSLVFFRMGNMTGQLVSSIFVILFYLFLIYYMTWQVGDEDRRAIASGRRVPNPLRGLYMSLLANSLNIFFAVMYAVGAHGFGAAAVILEGMYAGVLMQPYGTGVVAGGEVALTLAGAWWMYFLIVTPALAVSTISYYFGTKNLYLTPIFHPTNPEKKKRKKD